MTLCTSFAMDVVYSVFFWSIYRTFIIRTGLEERWCLLRSSTCCECKVVVLESCLDDGAYSRQ
jgi:hypothetical protein